MLKRLLIVSELYYPEETSTGFFVTGIAEGLSAKGHPVSVLCAQPTYSRRGIVAPEHENVNGVEIERIAAPRVDKNRLLARVWILIVLSIRFAWRFFRTVRRDDQVLVLTNPPSLPMIVALFARWKGAEAHLLVHDVYPDVLVPTGLTREGSLIYRMINAFQRWMLNRMDGVIVLGRDMQKRISEKMDPQKASPVIIPNWGDVARIRPEFRQNNPLRTRLGLLDHFVVQFSGNLGRTHGLEDLVELATTWKDRRDVAFLVFGWGAGREWLQTEINSRELSNIHLLEPCSREELPEYLTACDLFFLPFKKGMEGISVPSRLYNVLAAGSPLLGVCGESSELAQVIQQEEIGWVVSPGDISAMSGKLEVAINNRAGLETMSQRARRAAERKYTREIVVNQFHEYFEGGRP